MKKFTRPFIEVIKFETTDIIHTSGLIDGGSEGDFTGGGGQGGWGQTTTSIFN